MNLLITGGCGFLGSNLAAEALRRGDTLLILDNLSRHGSRENLAWLQQQGRFEIVEGDIRDAALVAELIASAKPDCVIHLAGQVAMTTSLANPRSDFEINALGTVNVLEAVRLHAPETGVIYSSTNKVYGDLEQYSYTETASRYECVERPNGFDELTQLNFESPYGCSKGAADQYVLDYSRAYGLNGVVFRHSSMYGGRQYPTADQGWIGWFCQQALVAGDQPLTISGNGKQVRDVLYADDMVALYFRAAEQVNKIRGEAFNIGGGIENSLSLLELFQLLENLLHIELQPQSLPPRLSDQKFFVAELTKVTRLLGWKPLVSAEQGISRAVDWARSLNAETQAE